MFGIVVAGRPVYTTFQTVSPTQISFTIPSQPAFSHIVIFVLPGNTLPESNAAAVYVQIPPAADFKFLGAVSNEKQSAIFKINDGAASAAVGNTPDDSMTDDATVIPALGTASTAQSAPSIVLGISLEPVASIEAQMAQLKNTAQPQLHPGTEAVVHRSLQQSAIPTKVLAQRIIKNAFNFLSSFTAGSGGQELVPLKSFQDWWVKFEKKIELDPSFLDKESAD